MLEDKPFSKKHQLTLFLDYGGYESALYAFELLYAQHYPIINCFLVVRDDADQNLLEDLQLLFPSIKIHIRKSAKFLDCCLSLSKLIDTQFVAAFDLPKLQSNWAISEAVNKIYKGDDWFVKLDNEGISFVALRLVFEKTNIKELENKVAVNE